MVCSDAYRQCVFPVVGHRAVLFGSDPGLQVREQVRWQTDGQVALKGAVLDIQHIHPFNRFVDLPIICGGRAIATIGNQKPHKREKELQIVRSIRQTEWIDSERLASISESDVEGRSPVLFA